MNDFLITFNFEGYISPTFFWKSLFKKEEIKTISFLRFSKNTVKKNAIFVSIALTVDDN